MKMDRIIQLLEIERQCVSSNCDRQCDTCELVQEQDELVEMYSFVIKMLKGTSAHAKQDGAKWYCGHCGCRIPDKFKCRFCTKCGTAILRPEIKPETSEKRTLYVRKYVNPSVK